MSRREEKRRKFNEAVVNLLYPPPQTKSEDLTLDNHTEPCDSNAIPDSSEFGKTSSSTTSSEENDNNKECDTESRKLTRAQRKRVRRKKLKIDSSQRRGTIGPLLHVDDYTVQNDTPSVRQKAAEKPLVEEEQCGGSGNKSKVKQRRKAKKTLVVSMANDFDDQSLNPKSCNQENL